MDEKNEERKLIEIMKGIGILIAFHLVWIIFPGAYFAIGLVQLFYVIPVVVYYYKKDKEGIAQGVLIGAGITFLLNAACFGIVIGTFG